jgi:hypothetical protein
LSEVSRKSPTDISKINDVVQTGIAIRENMR